MKINADNHTHTVYSHGKNTIEENVKKALEIGLEKIAITDHGSGHVFYGVDKDDWVKMRKEIDGLKQKYPQLEIIMGVEANIIGSDGSIDVEEDQLELFDVINAGFHYGIKPKKAKDFFSLYLLNFLGKLLPFLKAKARAANTKALVNAMDKNDLNMITHPGAKVPVDMDKVARKAQDKNVILEINAHHLHLDESDLKKAMKYDVKFAINSDAHQSEHVGMVEEGIKIARAAGLEIHRIINGEDD
ncbi:MAG TPA: histidinol-phosphatase [Eubacteriaceae bacterium]|jgi:putative hydrolase|nr:histidinol-phosphatase [Eubacteriaceae bacterium]